MKFLKIKIIGRAECNPPASRWMTFAGSMHVIFFGVLLLIATVPHSEAEMWTSVVVDDFNRANSSAVGNNWNDPDSVARIENKTLVLTLPVGGSGTDLRVSRPLNEAALYQRIEATSRCRKRGKLFLSVSTF